MSPHNLITDDMLKRKSMPWDAATIFAKMKSTLKPRRNEWDGASTPTSSAAGSETSTLFEVHFDGLQAAKDGERLAHEDNADYRLLEENCRRTSDAHGVSPAPRYFPRPAQADLTGTSEGYEHSPRGLFARSSKKVKNTSGVMPEMLDPEDRAWM